MKNVIFYSTLQHVVGTPAAFSPPFNTDDGERYNNAGKAKAIPTRERINVLI
jgi:hypothetical protein